MMYLLFIASALCYGGASFVFSLESGREPGAKARRLSTWGRVLLAAAAVLHFLSIGMQCVEGDHPLKNIFLATSFATWIAVVGFLPLSVGGRLDALGPIMAPLGLMGLVLGVVFSEAAGGSVMPGSAWVASAHVGLAAGGFAGFSLAAGVSGLYLIVERRLRKKVFEPGGARGMSLTGLDRLQYRLVLLTMPIFTLAIVTGVIWIVEGGGVASLRGRTFEIVAGLVAWFASVALLVARAVWGTRGRQSAALNLLSFGAVALIVVWYGVRT